MCNNVVESGQVFDGLLIADNLFVYARPTWHEGNLSNICPDGVYFALSFDGGCPNFGGETICVENNVFCRAKGHLIERCLKESHKHPETTPQYAGNVFAQTSGGMLMMADSHHFKDKNIQATDREKAQQQIDAELLGAGEVIILSPKD